MVFGRRRTEEKDSRSNDRINNKLNTHMMPGLGVEPENIGALSVEFRSQVKNCYPLERLCNREIKTRVYGKRQTSESRLRFLKINNKHKRIVQNNSCVYGKHESTYLHLVMANGKRQMGRNHGNVVSSAVCRFP